MNNKNTHCYFCDERTAEPVVPIYVPAVEQHVYARVCPKDQPRLSLRRLASKGVL